jgi:hypothetical protein
MKKRVGEWGRKSARNQITTSHCRTESKLQSLGWGSLLHGSMRCQRKGKASSLPSPHLLMSHSPLTSFTNGTDTSRNVISPPSRTPPPSVRLSPVAKETGTTTTLQTRRTRAKYQHRAREGGNGVFYVEKKIKKRWVVRRCANYIVTARKSCGCAPSPCCPFVSVTLVGASTAWRQPGPDKQQQLRMQRRAKNYGRRR